MTNRILSLATAAAIALSAIGTTAPAMAAAPAPVQAITQTADSLLTEVGHKGRHKKRGFKRGGISFGGKGFGVHLNFGNKGFHKSHRHCFRNKRVWTRFGWRVQRVNICR